MNQVVSPFAQFFTDNGVPLDGGSIYIGVVNQNPKTSPITAYWDEAGTQPAAQPIRTSGGYPVRHGTVARLYVNADDYSMSVYDSRGALVFYEPSMTSTATLRADLAGPNGADLVGLQQTQITGAIQGTLKDRIYDINAVADFGADPLGVDDSTDALENFFDAMTSGCVAILPPGNYKYTPVIGSAGRLNMVSLFGVNLFAYGAVITNSFQVTTATSVSESLYGVHILSCTDCNIHGLKFDGNRDTTYGTNGDGNEFYSGFYVTGSTRCKLIDCIGVNCQGDGASFNRITGNTGFNNDCGILGGYFGGNRRNEISMGGDYDWSIDGGVILVGGSDAHRTNPKAGIDVEWEHATIGPIGNNQRGYIGNVSCSGTMAGGGIYMPRAAGITVGDGFRTYGLLGASINIDNTATGNYETQGITIGACHLDSVYGIGITGGADISIKGTVIDATYPITIDSPLSAAPYPWVAHISGVKTIGESVYGIKVTRGRTILSDSNFTNCSSGGGDNFMALFVPTCEVRNVTFTRDSNQSAPGNGVIFASASSIGQNISISSATTITHPISYGQNSVAAYAKTQNNFYNGSPLPDTVATRQFASALVDMASATPAMLYTPRGDPSEIAEILLAVAVAGSNVVSTTTMVIGIASNDDQYLTTFTVSSWSRGAVLDITGSLATVNTDYSDPIFVTPTPGNNNPKVQFMITTRYNRASLYTSSVLFG